MTLTTLSGIAFDCYGTLLEIRDDRKVTRRLYRQMARWTGPSPMIADIGLEEALCAGGVQAEVAAAIGRDAIAEANSAEPLPDALRIIETARRTGLRLAISSNLSREYADPIRRWFPDIPLLLSYEVGAAKPDAAMFAAVGNVLGPGRHLMVGDSRRCDHDGALDNGFAAILIASNPVPNTTSIRCIGDLPGALGWHLD